MMPSNRVGLILGNILMCSLSGLATGEDLSLKPDVYLHVGHTISALDTVAEEHFASTYRVVTFVDGPYLPPRGGRQGEPSSIYVDGECRAGRALVLYVIDKSGRVRDAFAEKATDKFVSNIAVGVVNKRTYQPARFAGKEVNLIVASDLHFTCP